MRRGRRVARTRKLRETALGPTGDLPVGFRAALMERAEELSGMSGGRTRARVPEDLHRYTEKVVLNAYKVTDKGIAALREAGYSEDEIFEITMSTAVGTGLTRLEAALGALDLEERHADEIEMR